MDSRYARSRHDTHNSPSFNLPPLPKGGLSPAAFIHSATVIITTILPPAFPATRLTFNTQKRDPTRALSFPSFHFSPPFSSFSIWCRPRCGAWAARPRAPWGQSRLFRVWGERDCGSGKHAINLDRSTTFSIARQARVLRPALLTRLLELLAEVLDGPRQPLPHRHLRGPVQLLLGLLVWRSGGWETRCETKACR